MDDAALRTIIDIADASPIPCILYNMPSTLGLICRRRLSSDSLSTTTLSPSRIAAATSSSWRRAAPGLERFPGVRRLGGVPLPCDGTWRRWCVLALANIAPSSASTCTSSPRRAHDEARQLQLRLIPATHGNRGFRHLRPKGGVRYGGTLRRPHASPLRPLNEQQLAALRSTLEKAGIL